MTTTADGSRTRPLLVFVVEDQPAVATALAGILYSSGCEVKTFLSGRDLMTSPSDATPDVVVTDFIMQPVDGLTIAAWVGNTYPKARIVMITNDEMVVRRTARRDLPFPIIEKPVNSRSLIAAVHGVAETEVPGATVA
jgi:FixJ family two-component response regulator